METASLSLMPRDDTKDRLKWLVKKYANVTITEENGIMTIEGPCDDIDSITTKLLILCLDISDEFIAKKIRRVAE